MNSLFKVTSYIFHPLWIPFAGSLFYFLISPRYFAIELVKAKLMAIAIMTLFIPIVFYFMLKTLGKASSYFLEDVRERKWPLLFNIALTIVVVKFILDPFDFPELFYYFLGITYSSIAALVFVFLNLKISLHMMGLAGISMFIIALSLHFKMDFIYTISFLIAITGLTASSRFHFKAHSSLELILGFLAGILPQAVLMFQWL